jgi:hypothetical protein
MAGDDAVRVAVNVGYGIDGGGSQANAGGEWTTHVGVLEVLRDVARRVAWLRLGIRWAAPAVSAVLCGTVQVSLGRRGVPFLAGPAIVKRDLEGGCFCGRIRYRARSVFDAGYCHCSVCRRIHGAPVVAWVAVPEPDFIVFQGTPRKFQSSAEGARHSCAECGTQLYYTDSRDAPSGVGSRLVSVYLTTLDDAASVSPRVHQWWGDHLPWFDTRSVVRYP